MVAALICMSWISATAANVRSPNVVLILIDDLSQYGVNIYASHLLNSQNGFFENVKFATPRMDQLAREGMMAMQAHTYPLCENTRVALMSGQNNNRNYLDCKSQHASDITFGDTFKRAGYATGIFGKWKQTRGTPRIPAKDYIYEFGWDEFACFDVVGEEQRYINPNLVINGEVCNFMARNDLDPETGRRWYGPDICNRYALQFIEKNQDKPFFLYYPMMLVHDEHKPTPDTQPHRVFDTFPEQKGNHDGVIGDDHRYFPDMIEYCDTLIGRIVDKIDELGLTHDTLIVVMGDNGTKESFAHVLDDGSIYPARKGGTTDNGTHVPLIIRQPGTVSNAANHQPRQYTGLIHLTDIYPTIAEAAGVDIPNKESIDGISFWAQAKGAEGEPRSYIHGWFNGNNPYTKSDDTLTEWVMDKQFKRYAPSQHFPEGRFFDLRWDPLERAGGHYVERLWKVRQYSGLDLNDLDSTQKAAYERLGEILETHRIVPVELLQITPTDVQLNTGESLTLRCEVNPANATRRNVIWESDNPAVASVNKFGEVTAHTPGTATIAVYSWSDANPLANGHDPEFLRDGVKDHLQITVISN